MEEVARGFTLMELVIVIALLGVLFLLFFWVYPKQIQKTNDARKKEDLDKLRVVLQEYYSDNKCFPKRLECGESFSPYLEIVPCDPETGLSYRFVPEPDADCPQWYKIYTELKVEDDPVIDNIGCSSGCGPIGEETTYNYGVCSSNVRVGETFTTSSWSREECPIVTSCFDVHCNVVSEEDPDFHPDKVCSNTWFCDTNCNGLCWQCPSEGCQEDDDGDGVPDNAVPIEEKQCH